MFWKSNGEDIDWNSIEYDEDFFPTDTVEAYGDYGEWKFREFKPIYAGYGTTEDGLNYLIGKYLDEEGEEKTVNILVSGEGIVEWPFPDKGFIDFYNSYYKENVAIRGENWDPEPYQEVNTSDIEYSAGTEFYSLADYELYACPEEVILSNQEAQKYTDLAEDMLSYSFTELETFGKYCNLYNMYYSDYPAKILYSFSYIVGRLQIGDQFSVIYLDTEKTFEECRYDYNDVQKIFCANEYLNETYDDFLVGIYIEVYY